MPSETYYKKLTTEMAKYLPPFMVSQATQKARAHAGGKAPRKAVDPGISPDTLDETTGDTGTTFGQLLSSRIHRAYTTLSDDIHGLGLIDKPTRLAIGQMIGDLLTECEDVLTELGVQDLPVPSEIAQRMVITKRTRQVFSSIGGKSAIAKKLISAFPPHQTYVEPFAGGAACYFKKDPSPQEVLSDMAEDVVFLYQAVQQLQDSQIQQLAQRDWVVSRETFNALRDYKRAGQFSSGLDKLYTLLYLKHAVFGSGDESKSVDVSRIGKSLTIPNDLAMIRDRMKNTKVVRADARQVIKAFDSPDTFFYLDPPYPGGTSQRKDYAYGGEFSVQDLQDLCKQLEGIQGKFLMSLPGVVEPFIPDTFHKEYVDTPVLQGRMRMPSRELAVSNYGEAQKVQPDAGSVHINKPLEDISLYKTEDDEVEEGEIIQKSEEQRLVWMVVMKPWFVDYERQWSDPEAIMKACHYWMLNGAVVGLEHVVDVSSRVACVENYILPIDWNIPETGRDIKAGTWIAVFWIHDDEIWQMVKDGKIRGASVRGPATIIGGQSPPPELETRVAAA